MSTIQNPIRYNIAVNDSGEAAVTFVSHQGVIVTVPQDHPNFSRITHALVSGQDPEDFLDVTKAIQALDGRVTVGDNVVYFEGNPIHNSVTQAILRYQREGREYGGLVRFLERVQENPSKHSRDQLYTWLDRQDLAVDPDGRFLGFKAVNKVDPDDAADDEVFNGNLAGTSWDAESDIFQSVSQGTAFVDGVKFEGYILNFVGAVVSMDRRDVDDDFSKDCSYGLHVGAYSYASTFGGRDSHLLVVAVAPEDVASVPKYDTSKLRTCKYEVLEVQEKKRNDLSAHEAEASFSDDDVISALSDEIPETWLGRLFSKFRRNEEEL